MEYFIDYKNVSKSDTNKLISTTKTFKNSISLLNYSIKKYEGKKMINEDEVYLKNKVLQEKLPRACTFITVENDIIDVMEGPRKFGGYTPIDEDDFDENPIPSIFDNKQITEWAVRKELTVFETEKANGKFAICKIMKYKSQLYLIFGSKNSHHLLLIDNNNLVDLDNTIKYTDIVESILSDISKYLNILTSDIMLKYFLDGYSLVGELCDGQHFTPGDNTISWFGLFKNGLSLPTDFVFPFLLSCGFKTVSCRTLYDSESDISILDKVFLESRCKNNEGSVLRFQNDKTKEIVLVKSKSAIYIVKRFFRTIWTAKNRGSKSVEYLQQRFIDAQQYHGLNTNASIRLTHCLYDFAIWLIKECYPVGVLGHQPVVGTRGILPNGFNIYWEKFLRNTKHDDMYLTYDDFGNFDEQEYLKNTEIYKKRSYCDPVLVVFTQDIQGSGKSSRADKICEKLGRNNAIYFEQDMFWGCTDACKGAIYHSIMNSKNPKILIISRCNVEPTQYGHYLSMIHHLPTKVIFIAPYEINELYFMISLSGIIKRSINTDKLLVGRKEHPIEEVIEFTKKNYFKFITHPQAYKIKLFENDEKMLEISKNLLKSSDTEIQNFVQNNHEKLNSLRLSLDLIVDNIIRIIKNPLPETLVLMENPQYIGAAISYSDKEDLTNFVNKFVPDNENVNKTYIHHCTLIFNTDKKNKNSKLDTKNSVIPGQIVICYISCLVIRKNDNACAFKINKIIDKETGKNVFSTQTILHITARIPKEHQPSISNGFIDKTNQDIVKIIPYEKIIELVSFWS